MRTALLIVSLLFIVATIGMGSLGTKEALKDAREIATEYQANKTEIAAMAKQGSAQARKLVDLGEGVGTMKAGAVLMGAVAALALALGIMLFVKKGVPLLALGIVACALLAMILSPQYETSVFQGASARTLSYIVAAVAGLAAAAAFGADRLRTRART